MSSSPTSPKTIVIACGGTGGHLFPGIAVAEALIRRGHRAELLISKKSVDSQGSEKYQHLSFHAIPAIAKPATFSPAMLPFLLKLVCTTRDCRRILRESGAAAVLGMGGFTSLPPVYAGHRLGLATLVHDSNARPGRSNILTSRFCQRVLLGMEPAAEFFPKRTCIVTGTPVRAEILQLPEQSEARRSLGLDPELPTLLMIGGSQGAQRLNELCVETFRAHRETALRGIQMLHITGAGDLQRIRALAEGLPHYHAIGFCAEMPAAYASANLVLARSGASSITEFSIAGLPSILVPFPYSADQHQTRNAEVFERAGASILRQQTDLDPASLANLISSILTDPAQAAAMAAAARKIAAPNAADNVCDAIVELLHK